VGEDAQQDLAVLGVVAVGPGVEPRRRLPASGGLMAGEVAFGLPAECDLFFWRPFSWLCGALLREDANEMRKRLLVSFPPEEPSGCFAEMTPGVFFASAELLFASPEKQVTPIAKPFRAAGRRCGRRSRKRCWRRGGWASGGPRAARNPNHIRGRDSRG